MLTFRYLIGAVVLICLQFWMVAQSVPRTGLSPELFATSDQCLACHNVLVTPSGEDISFGSQWRASMMANSARDPYWQAAVRTEVLDHPESQSEIENECAACHMPMSRFHAKAEGRQESVFARLPIGEGGSALDALAADGVSCTMCHQIRADGLGTRESFTAGFAVDTEAAPGERRIYGPFEIDAGRKTIMHSASRFEPQSGAHIQSSDFCATCHTLFTHTLGPGGEVIGELPEQVPFLEWKHSAYAETESCQDCHMPAVPEEMVISSVLGELRTNVSRHSFRGGNFFMLRMLNRYRDELGVIAPSRDLDRAASDTVANLQSAAARVAISSLSFGGGRLEVQVEVENQAGHKLPTAYPSRRSWIHVKVRDGAGNVLFESGGLHPDGSIEGNDNDSDATRFEPHYEMIDRSDHVQIYEPILVDRNGQVTTGLLTGLRYVKDNRLLPGGFDKTTASQDIAVHGGALSDADFRESGDSIRYVIDVGSAEGPFTLDAELWYQPIGYRWAQNLRRHKAQEIDRFVAYYESMSETSATVLARDSKTVPGS